MEVQHDLLDDQTKLCKRVDVHVHDYVLVVKSPSLPAWATRTKGLGNTRALPGVVKEAQPVAGRVVRP